MRWGVVPLRAAPLLRPLLSRLCWTVWLLQMYLGPFPAPGRQGHGWGEDHALPVERSRDSSQGLAGGRETREAVSGQHIPQRNDGEAADCGLQAVPVKCCKAASAFQRELGSQASQTHLYGWLRKAVIRQAADREMSTGVPAWQWVVLR